LPRKREDEGQDGEAARTFYISFPSVVFFPVCHEQCEQNVKYALKLLTERKGHTHIQTPSLFLFLPSMHVCISSVCMNVYGDTPTQGHCTVGPIYLLRNFKRERGYK